MADRQQVYRSSNAEIADAYRQQSAAAKRLQDDFRARVKADGPGVESAVAAVMDGMDLYEAASRFGVDPAAVHKRTNYAREMGFSLDPSVQSRADWMTERDTNRAEEFANRTDTDVGEGGPRYRLVNRDGTQQIYDTEGGALYSMNMATQEMLDAVGRGVGAPGGTQVSTRPANAATLPGQVAAPVINGAVQNGVQGNPTQAERDLGTRSTLPGGIDRPPPAAPVLQPQSATPTPAAPRMALPRLQQTSVPLGSGMSATDMFLALSGAGVAAPQFQQQPEARMQVAAPRMMVADASQSGLPAPRPGQMQSFAEPFALPGGAPAMAQPFADPYAGQPQMEYMVADRAPQVLLREDAPVAAPRVGGTKIRALSASIDPGIDEGDVSDDTNPPVTPPQGGHWETPPPTYDPSLNFGQGGWRQGNPVWVPDRTPPQGRDAAATGQDNASAAAQWANAYRTNMLAPAEFDQIMAAVGLTNEQAARIKALLPGELLQQGADLKRTFAEIENAAKRLGLDTSKFDWQRATDTATLLGEMDGRATLDKVKTFGFDQFGNPTLEAAKFIHDKELNYANSERADMLAGVTRSNTSGYMDDGSATLEREKLYADTDIANMAALSDRAYKAAQVALAQGDQAEAQRQFNISHELKNRIETGRLELDQQAAQRAWQKDPASFLDQAWASRGLQAPTFQAQAQPMHAPATGAAPRMMAEPAPAGQVAAPTFQSQQMQPQGRGVMAAPQMQQQASNVPAAMRPLNFDEIERSGSNLPGLSAAFKGEAQRSYSTAGGVPKLSQQRMNSLNSTERAGLDALLAATGNDSQTYREETARLSRVGEGPQQFRQRQVAAPRFY